MATPNGTRLVPIAPAPASAPGVTNHGTNANVPQPVMPYTCQTCARRKVKCDKVTPLCSSCRKGDLDCVYQAPLPRSRKRKLSGEVLERLARYERILHQHGLLNAEPGPCVEGATSEDPISLQWSELAPSGKGTLLAGQGKSRYIDSSLWRSLGDEETCHVSDEEDQESPDLASDPLTGALMGFHQSLFDYHPTQEQALLLWKIYIENVEPLYKILHPPSTSKMIEKASQDPSLISRPDECLLFAIYHFAVFSMDEEECLVRLGQSRIALMDRFRFAARQALVNASFLKTTDMSTLQALILFLFSCRHFYDPQTFWILTGVAVRIAQRIGLHHDGEKLGLPPFDVQMRRRLFYQLLPLDGNASQMSGVGLSAVSNDWDTQLPLNINDDQIWPGMTERPEERKAATEMIFCLSRSCVGRILGKAGVSAKGAVHGHLKDREEADRVISEAENELEEKYIRYCDIVNPLHFLTIGLARSGITAMRIRVRLPRVRNGAASDTDWKELFQLAEKILDTDVAAYSHVGLRKRFHWYIKPFYLWGMWDSLILILTVLWKRLNLLSPMETEVAWRRIEHIYNNHDDLSESKRALYILFGRLVLKAWDAHTQETEPQDPPFIGKLRSSRDRSPSKRVRMEPDDAYHAIKYATLPGTKSPANCAAASMGNVERSGISHMDKDLDLEFEDWLFWDRLVEDHQAHKDQE